MNERDYKIMREQTIFEKLEIEYQEIDGIFYPVLSVPTEEEQLKDIGKYGRMWIGHMKSIYPIRYRSLVRFGELNSKAMEVNEVAYDLLDDIESGWLQKHKPRNVNSFMEQLHLRNQARMMAEEMVLHDVVYQFH
jgi:hypothetical protein